MPATWLAVDARVALAPRRTYFELVTGESRGSWLRALRGPLFAALVIGVVLSISATHVASITGVASVAIFWAFVPAVQLFTAWTTCRRPPVDRVTLPRAIELLFLAHVPYSLWLLAFAAGTFVMAPGPALVNGLLAAAIVPIAWTPVLIAAFSREVLGCTPREARRRTILHQALTWGVIVALVILADQPWARYGGGA